MPKASVKRLIDSRKDKLIEFVLDIEKYPEFIPFCENSKIYEKNENSTSINIIADLTIGKGPFKDEFVTCGGVPRSEINFNTMESRVCPNLFIIGECIDIDGITGGFNFQNAWTTAWLAARKMG